MVGSDRILYIFSSRANRFYSQIEHEEYEETRLTHIVFGLSTMALRWGKGSRQVLCKQFQNQVVRGNTLKSLGHVCGLKQ